MAGNKSVGPDGISHKILKELANFLAAPVTSIINSSLHQGIVPDQWKISRITRSENFSSEAR